MKAVAAEIEMNIQCWLRSVWRYSLRLGAIGRIAVAVCAVTGFSLFLWVRLYSSVSAIDAAKEDGALMGRDDIHQLNINILPAIDWDSSVIKVSVDVKNFIGRDAVINSDRIQSRGIRIYEIDGRAVEPLSNHNFTGLVSPRSRFPLSSVVEIPWKSSFRGSIEIPFEVDDNRAALRFSTVSGIIELHRNQRYLITFQLDDGALDSIQLDGESSPKNRKFILLGRLANRNGLLVPGVSVSCPTEFVVE